MVGGGRGGHTPHALHHGDNYLTQVMRADTIVMPWVGLISGARAVMPRVKPPTWEAG